MSDTAIIDKNNRTRDCARLNAQWKRNIRERRKRGMELHSTALATSALESDIITTATHAELPNNALQRIAN